MRECREVGVGKIVEMLFSEVKELVNRCRKLALSPEDGPCLSARERKARPPRTHRNVLQHHGNGIAKYCFGVKSWSLSTVMFFACCGYHMCRPTFIAYTISGATLQRSVLELTTELTIHGTEL